MIMPEMGGKELYERLIMNYPEMKVLFMSGYSGEEVAGKGVYVEESAFIQKPFTHQGLAKKIREVLDQAGKVKNQPQCAID